MTPFLIEAAMTPVNNSIAPISYREEKLDKFSSAGEEKTRGNNRTLHPPASRPVEFFP